MLLPLLFLQYVKGQETSKDESIKGYLMLVKHNNEIIFFPCKNACKKYSLKKISKINGYLIRGQNSYKMHLAEQLSEKYDVMMPLFYENADSVNYMPMKIHIVAVELKYHIILLRKKESVEFPLNIKVKVIYLTTQMIGTLQ